MRFVTGSLFRIETVKSIEVGEKLTGARRHVRVRTPLETWNPKHNCIAFCCRKTKGLKGPVI